MFDLSIVLPTKNRADHLLQALMGIERSTHCAYEVIIIDGASTDKTDEVLLLAGSIMGSRLRTIREGTRVGFAAACNKGIDLARGRNVCVLHDDVHPIDGALDAAINQLDHEADDRAILALYAPTSLQSNVAITRNANGQSFGVSHVRGTLVAEFPLARRAAFGARPFDTALQTTAAAIEFSLRSWDAGYRVLPANDSLLEALTPKKPETSIDKSELLTVLTHWNLPAETVAFDPATPCTLRGTTQRRAA